MSAPLTLTDADLDAIADRVVAKLGGQTSRTFGMLDARQLAAELGVSRAFVYEHARELGAIKLGTTPRARVKFDLEDARRRLREMNRPTVRDRRRPTGRRG